MQIASGRKTGWNYVPRPAVHGLLLPAPLVVGLVTTWGILLPASILQSDWYAALAWWVGFNTLIFAFLSLLQLLPPLHRRRKSSEVVAQWTSTF